MKPSMWKLRNVIYGLLCLGILLLNGSTALAQSLSPDDSNSLYNDTVWYKPGAGSGNGVNGGGTVCVPALTGSGNAQQAWNYFISQTSPKLTPVQVAAILGNMDEESGIDPQKVQSDGDSPNNPLDGATGWGIAQWTNLGRQQNLQSFGGNNDDTLPVQLAFISKEGSSNLATLSTIQDLKAAVDYWMSNYEQPYVPTELEDVRLSDANYFLILYGSGGNPNNTAPPTNDCTNNSNGSGSGGPPFGGSIPSGTAQQLAQQLVPYINNGKIKCVGSGGTQAYDVGCSDITDTANGVGIPSGLGCAVSSLSPALLGMMLKLVQMGHTFYLSAICSDHAYTGTSAPGHSTGQAADFNTIDGVFIGPSDTQPWDQTKIQAAEKFDRDVTSFMPTSTGFGQIQCHPTFDFLASFVTFPDGCSHQHIQVTG